MNTEAIQQIVFDALVLTNHAREDDKQISLSSEIELFGNDGCLDSMELVGLLISIEEAMLDEGYTISLSDERAMSQTRSPFRNVKTLVAYVESLLHE